MPETAERGQDCFICKKGGHYAKDCPEKQKRGSLKSQICLKCGDSGHDMFSCRNDYLTEDLKEIQCYVCKRFGHLCCVKYVDTSPQEVSCYRCGQLGHTGMTHQRFGELSNYSTPILKSHKEKRDYTGFKSAPHDLNKAHKRKQTQYEERGMTTPQKTKHRGGWIMDDPGDFSPRNGKRNSWKSPATPPSGRVHASSSRSSKKMWKVSGSPISQGQSRSFHHRYSASRFSNSSADGIRRNYDWW
ncbi:hypothetical protein PRUPE_6G179900 [Prunus persica]|uniref:CCHC-type domain-containing protein n=1 Tax=Prunus persica TaxID=3760 RepID=A0A251NS37_PRUPE|nr:hypothetical protein PRUPE_6G179900 [Prunus persica]